ncbi:MAG: TolC family protein [Candidatus Eremiobacteraeota bacterium]|nr:TolC family protein [Candidatus Eremiobacteraeota bacterium]
MSLPSGAPTTPPALQPTTIPGPQGSQGLVVPPLGASNLGPTSGATPLPALAGTLALSDVLRETDLRNPDILAANAAIVAAQARVQQATNAPLQSLLQPSIAQDVPGGVRQVQLLTVGLQQQIVPGLAATKRVARFDVALARAAAAGVRRDVRQRVVDAYYALAAAQSRTTAAQQNVTSANDLVAAARLRQRAGAIGGFEVLRATVDARRAQTEVLQARGALRQAAIALGADVGRIVDQAARLSLAPSVTAPLLAQAAAVESVLRRDPTSRQLRATLARSSAQLTAARAQRLPTLSLAGGYTLERAPHLGGLTSQGPTASIGLTIPILDYGTIRGAEREARANAATTRLQITGRELQLRAAIASAAADIESTHARLSFSEESLRQAQEGLRIAQIGFRQGALRTLDVISARTAAVTARADRDQARAEYADSIAKLQILLGDPIAP